MSSLLLRNIKTLVQAEVVPRQWVKGPGMADLPVVQNAFLLIEDDQIAGFGPMENCPDRADRVIDASGRMVFPSWCDSHTHIVFAASREDEFVDRIRGLSYEQIALRGGGILNSARRLQQTSEDLLFESAWKRLKEVIGFGTGAIEIKSGYGLNVESELKMLRVIRRLKAVSPIPVKATFLGAHAIPADYKHRRREYVDMVVQQMLPKVAAEGLADYCDVFCDRGFFTVEETERILNAGWNYGLKPKIHANELDFSGGVQVGVAHHAVSVDHLEHTGDAEIEALRNSATLPTLLPACSFFLGIPYAPARRIIDAGLPVVLATDYNPGSAPSGRMAFVVSLACIQMKILPEEAINAATINGARAMELEGAYGSISPGKKANIFITKPIPSLAHLPYAFGNDPVDIIVLNGRVWQDTPQQ
ncbi:MAG: imidazolonepropionase [Saprospirales bacterium]|jgi:imidazolonepropionase|nr:imidazolonepropionase [Saprospirales bacterium]